MAAREVRELEPETGRYLCRVRREDEWRGYKRDILTENLSQRDAVFLCNRCQGMMKEVCISTDGEQFCSCCKKDDEQTNPNLHVSNIVLSFKCSCPLISRGCEWLGTLAICEDHLDTCGYVLETCGLRCGVVLQSNELKVHEKENCPQRIVECEHCRRDFKSCELPTHLDSCPKVKVSCELNCGVLVCRDSTLQHLEQECGLVEEECNLGCGMKLIRNELRIHVTDTCVLRLVPCEHCKRSVKFCDMSRHLEMCPKIEVSCEFCGKVMCREDMTQHLKVDCVEKEIKCPFAKYKCEVGLIKRKYLSQHLEEKRIEHLELKLNAMETIIKDLRLTVEKQSGKIREQGQEIELMKTKKKH